MLEDQVVLPGFVIASLYKDTLVECSNYDTPPVVKQSKPTETIAAAPVQLPINSLKFLGGNKNHISIIISEPEAMYINDDDLAFLSNVLSACKFTLDDISIFNIYNNPIVVNEVKEKMETKYFLLFGVEPTSIKMPFEIPNFQVQQYAGTTILTAPPLHEMKSKSETSIALKRQLWDSLQRCFGIEKKMKR